MFEERKEKVSETAKEIVDSAFRKIDLEDYAREYAQNKYCSEQNKTPNYKIAQIHAGREGFINGAIFMRNSVWHAAVETPLFKFILIDMGGRFDVIKIKGDIWKMYVKNYGVKRYAYIEDLIPIED